VNILAIIFGVLFVVALLTGKAYFRGAYRRDENPRRYWTIVACYATLLIGGLIMPHLSPIQGAKKGDGTPGSSWTWPRFELPFGLLTDAATRLAGDLEDGAAEARRTSDGRATIEHLPKASPEGCADDYRVQFSQASLLVVWCYSAGNVTSSHSTTSHLPAVDVPRTWIVDKQKGESLFVNLERRGDRVVVTGVQ